MKYNGRPTVEMPATKPASRPPDPTRWTIVELTDEERELKDAVDRLLDHNRRGVALEQRGDGATAVWRVASSRTNPSSTWPERPSRRAALLEALRLEYVDALELHARLGVALEVARDARERARIAEALETVACCSSDRLR